MQNIFEYLPEFYLAERFKRKVLGKLLAIVPVLYMVCPVTCPNLMLERKEYYEMEYTRVSRWWRRYAEDPQYRYYAEARYSLEQARNKAYVFGKHYPLKSWQETVFKWRQHWRLFHYLPIKEGNDTYNFVQNQKRKIIDGRNENPKKKTSK